MKLTERTQIANRLGADLYVSLHANAHRDSQARGIETLVSERLSGARRRASTIGFRVVLVAESPRVGRP